MRKFACCLTLISCLVLASCNTSTDDNNTKAVEEKEDEAQKAADQMEDMADDTDTTAVQPVQ